MDKNQERKFFVAGAVAALALVGFGRYRKVKRMQKELNEWQEALMQAFYDTEFVNIVERNF